MIINKITNGLRMVRGDSESIKIHISGEYTYTSGDVIKLTVRKTPTASIAFQVTTNTISAATGGGYDATLSISPGNTSQLDFGQYVYDVEMTMAGTAKKTLIPCSTFMIGEEVTY